MTLHLTILSLWTLFSQQLDEGSRLLPILIASTGVAVYTVLALAAFDVIDILEFRILIYLIVWHLFHVAYSLFRMIRHSGVKISKTE